MQLVLIAFAVGLAQSARTPAIPSDFRITLESTACFGMCPVYSVTIDASGNVTYDGKRNVRVTGRRVATVPIASVAALVEAVSRVKFFELSDRYQEPVSDLPTTFVTVTLKGRTKRIEDYLGAPEALKTFENEIRSATRVIRWVRIDAPGVDELFEKGPRPSAEQAAAMLYQAVIYDDLEAIKALLRHGVPVHKKNAEQLLGATRSRAAAEALIAAGADTINLGSKMLRRLWYLETSHAELFIKTIPNIDAPDADGRTILFGAACVGNIGVVKLVLNKGANPAARLGNISAVECAQRNKNTETRLGILEKPRYVQDFDAVIALLQAALKR